MHFWGDTVGIEFRILPRRGLVYVRYEGTIVVSDSAGAFESYARHPDFHPGQKQLIDLGAVTGWEPDYPRLMALQAKKAGAILPPWHETLFVYYAPSRATREIAGMVLRSWEDVPAVVPLILTSEAEALAVLGQPEQSFSELLQSA